MKTSGPAGAANTTSSASIGIGFMLGGVQNGFTLQAGASSGRGKADGQDQTHLNTKIRTSPHLDSPTTQVIQGTYRGEPVTHFFDPQTGLNVVRDAGGNFLSGWKLSPAQIKNVTTTGKLGGG